MSYEFNPAKPIYYQLAERVCKLIVRKELNAGDKLPSVREFAVQYGVNPNTVQRTYRELEGMKIVETRRGQGTFVTENETILEQLRESLKQEHIAGFVQDMKEMGFKNDEILNGLTDYLNKMNKGETDDDRI